MTGSSRYRTVPTDTDQFLALKDKVRSLAIAVRTALGLNTLTVSSRLTVSGVAAYPPTIVALDQTASIIIDADLISRAKINLTSNAVNSSILGGTDGQELVVTWVQDAQGGRTYAWPTNCKFAGAAPNSTTADTRTTVKFVYDGGVWYELSRIIGVG